MPERFEVGEEVEVICQTSRSEPPVGTRGRVISACGTSVAVDFGVERMPGVMLWECDALPRPTGRYVPADTLQAVVPEVELLKPFFLVKLVPEGAGFCEEEIAGERFDTGAEAQTRGKQLTAELGLKVQPRRMKLAGADEWRAREQGRLDDGTYPALPEAWDLKPIEDHFLHLSKERKGFLAYTPSPEHGEQDRQVVLRPGAYLKKYYPDLNDRELARYGAIISCNGQLKFTGDPKEIKRVYREGPDSCMSGDFDTPVHPVEVYGAGDLQLAYLEEEDGEIIARCMTWPEKKLFTRAYGDIEKIKAQLTALGFSPGNFEGAKIKKVWFGDDWVCPYIDDCNSYQGNPSALYVEDAGDGKHLFISEHSGVPANDTDGYVNPDNEESRGEYCPECDDYRDEDGFGEVVTGRYVGGSLRRQNWCEGCRDDYTFRCDGLGEYVSAAVDSYEAHNGETWSRFYVEDKGAIESDVDNAMYPSEMIVEVITPYGTENWSKAQFEEDGFTCAGNGERYAQTCDSVEINGLTYFIDNAPTVEVEEEEEDEDLILSEAEPDERAAA